MRSLRCLLVAALLCPASPARAQVGANISEVEQAYAEVDFEKTRALSRAALERGRNDRAATARLYLLWATSAAALDHAEEARRAFAHVLAADPQLRLDKSLSPKIRAPYLEARGSLAMEQGKPPLELTLQRRQRELELGLYDALHVAKAIELSTRVQADEPFTRRRFEPQPLLRIPIPSGNDLELFAEALDQYGNVLFAHGSREEPRRLALTRSGEPRSKDLERPSASPTGYYATAATLAALGVASGIVATVMYVRREDAAQEWNSPSCEQPGRTRGQQCADVDDRRQRAEYMAIGLSAGSGALLIGSIVSLLLAPGSSQSKAGIGADAAPRSVMLTWQGAL